MNNIIYLETDSEITEAVDKLKEISGESVKLVVPARSSLLQSAVNMKLLKKTADESKKKLILVTNDKSAAAMAGKVGLPVAATLKSEPKITNPLEEEPESSPDIVEEQEKAESQAVNPEGQQFTRRNIEQTKQVKPKKSKKSKVPNYSKLQKRVFIAIGIVLALILLIIAWIFLPTAKVIIFAEANKKDISFNFTLNSTISTSNYQNQEIASKKVESSKDLNANFNATGKKNVGTKATGKITVQNCDDTNTHNLPAGSSVSSSGKKYNTNETITIKAGTAGGGVVTCSSGTDVTITAIDVGESYNVNGTSFSLAGFSALYKATGSTSGGSSKEVTVVTQADIDNAKKQMIEGASNSAKDELMKKDNKNVKVFGETFTNDVTNFKSSPEVGAEASNGTVSATVNYSMLSASVADLNQMFNKQLEADTSEDMEIYDNGYSNAQFKLIKLVNSSNAQMKTNTTAYVGKKIDKESLTKKLTNKPKKKVQDIVRDNVADIKSVQVEALPFSPNMPLMARNIKIEVKVNTEQ